MKIMTEEEAIEILTASDYFWLRPSEKEAAALNMAIISLNLEQKRAKLEDRSQEEMTRQEEIIQLRLEQESIKFYYVESLDDYWVGRRIGNFYYATWHERFGFIWSHSKYLPWGEHVVDENTWWKEHTYPSEPKEIPFTEWIVGFTKKYFQQEQIIHCKDCKHWHEWENGTGACRRNMIWVGTDYDDYCSFAEPKGSDGE